MEQDAHEHTDSNIRESTEQVPHEDRAEYMDITPKHEEDAGMLYIDPRRFHDMSPAFIPPKPLTLPEALALAAASHSTGTPAPATPPSLIVRIMKNQFCDYVRVGKYVFTSGMRFYQIPQVFRNRVERGVGRWHSYRLIELYVMRLIRVECYLNNTKLSRNERGWVLFRYEVLAMALVNLLAELMQKYGVESHDEASREIVVAALEFFE
ncbi:unnamed protein product [Periconia digitata]|uniref:Uncharacterized protein n=1 Tax=Periconia digitata TaxID=1303443 RepID=A0A9W4UAR4_9PLEO|nr:unnamed protein product [Periconia digitata]